MKFFPQLQKLISMNLRIINIVFIICILSNLVQTRLIDKETFFIDNFGDGSLTYGLESAVTSYAELDADSSGNLPSHFTICSAINIQAITTIQSFIQVKPSYLPFHLFNELF